MKDLCCPKCGSCFDYYGDYEGFDNDSEQEFTCPHCEAEFLATVYWDVHFTGERLKEKSEKDG